MTPKEKAEELVLRMYYHTNDVNIIAPTKFIAKQCALVAAEHIKNELCLALDNEVSGVHAIYWSKVKDEIEKL